MTRPRQTNVVSDTIIARIDQGVLLPGDTIDEKDLMAVCGVSRTPVREALIQLEADGLIVRHARKGAQMFRPSVDEFLCILEVHATLEAQAAELAARRITDPHLTALRACATACTEFAARTDQTDTHAQYYALNMRFHEIIAEASCNPFLIEIIKLNARKLMAYYRLRYRTPGAIDQSAREHAQIAARIADRDASGARDAMAAHFNYERETVMTMLALVRPSDP